MMALEQLTGLRNPVMVAAFEGWNDAGEAASDVVAHLVDEWHATPVAALDPEDYYDFQVNRPRAIIEGGERGIHWRTTRVLLASPPGADRDVILVQGIEPSFRWRGFTEELVDLAEQAGVRTVLTLGALMADVAHTRPIPVTATSDDPSLRDRLGLEVSTYEGPTGIVGVLADAVGRAGLQSVSAWAAVPHYAGHTPSPKATVALLRRVEDLLDVSIPLGDLPEAARAWERGVNELADSDEEVAEYVTALEEAQDAADLPEASGDAIAAEFERYLRRRDDEG